MKQQKFVQTRWGMILTIVAVVILWGSPFPFIKKSYEQLQIASHEYGEQILFAGYRFFFAALLLFLFMLITKKALVPAKGSLIPLMKIGFSLTFLQYLFIYIGLSMSTGINVSIIIGSISLIQIVIAHFMLSDDQLNKKKLLAVLIGFLGITILQFRPDAFAFSVHWSEILVLLGAISCAIGNIFVKQVSKKIDTLQLTTYQMMFGAIGLLVLGMSRVGVLPFHFNMESLIIFIYLIVVSAGAFFLWNQLLKVYPLSQMSIYLCFIPIVGVLFSILFLHETFQLNHLISLFLVVMSIYVMNRST